MKRTSALLFIFYGLGCALGLPRYSRRLRIYFGIQCLQNQRRSSSLTLVTVQETALSLVGRTPGPRPIPLVGLCELTREIPDRRTKPTKGPIGPWPMEWPHFQR